MATGELTFGPFRLDRDAGCLWRGDTTVSLAPRPFALLCYLAERQGRLVTKEELLEAVWPEVFVGDAVLKVAVREIRRAIDDPAAAPLFIETVHGRGYRFRAQRRSGGLPTPLTSFIGRDAELAALRTAFSTSRLVTLRGAGGAGKTRLARQLASELIESVADGIWWIDLAGLERADLVVPAVAATLAIRDDHNRSLSATLSDFVRPRELLLVLDNCEHVLTGCVPIVEHLLAEGSRLRILTTSREPLGLPGEKVFVVPPLSLPSGGEAPDDTQRSEAVRLFVDRAHDVDDTFHWTREKGSTIAEICRRLDGLPLAIELVAARVAAFSLREILTQVEQGVTAVKRSQHTQAGRHQSLAAAFDWTYQSLSSEERQFLPQLSVFAGSPTLRAITAVCEAGSTSDVRDLVADLVNKSLISVVDTGVDERRYKLLEVVKQYLREKLSEVERERLIERHASWYALRADDYERRVNGADRVEVLAVLTADRDEFRAAIGSSLEAKPARALQLCSSLWWWWFHTNQWREGRDWLEAALQASSVSDVTRAQATCGAGALAWFEGDIPHAQVRLEEAVALGRSLNASAALARSLDFLGQVHADGGDFDAAFKCASEAVSLSRAIDDQWGLAIALIGLGNVRLFMGQAESAEADYLESASLCRAISDPWALGMALRNLGIVARKGGRIDQSTKRCRESLAALRNIDERWFVSRTLEELSKTLTLARKWRRAAELFGAAEALREAVGAAVLAVRYPEYASAVADVRAALGDDQFNAAWAHGRSLDRDAAIQLALAD